MADIESRMLTTSIELIKKYGHRSASMDDISVVLASVKKVFINASLRKKNYWLNVLSF